MLVQVSQFSGNKKYNNYIQKLAEKWAHKILGKYINKIPLIKIEFRVHALNELTNNLESDKGQVLGICFPPIKNCFLILIHRDLSLLAKIKTVVHELVHVKQYISKELILRRGRDPHVIWKGERVDYLSYSKRPWERAAKRIEDKIKRVRYDSLI